MGAPPKADWREERRKRDWGLKQQGWLQKGISAALGGTQKRAEAEGRTILWVDESGFYLLPLAVRTWAPRGQTPILRVKLTHDHLSAISGSTLDGRLFMQGAEGAYDSVGVVGFLRG